jgi:Outer membrane protein beta-barrel domain
MKRRILGYVAVMATVICLCAAPVFAADNFNANKVGVGYQGILWGNMMNGLSVRGWIGPSIGLEGNVYYGHASASTDSGDIGDASLWMVNAKFMYAFLVRANSKFYAGGQILYGQAKVNPNGDDSMTSKFWSPGVFAGAEWCFPQLPELGMNFELGYNYLSDSNSVDNSSGSFDIKLHGMNLGAGIHYYF